MGHAQLSNETAELQRLESTVWSCTVALIYTTLLCTILAMQRERGGCKSCPHSQPGLKAAFKADQCSNKLCTCSDGAKGNEMNQSVLLNGRADPFQHEVGTQGFSSLYLVCLRYLAVEDLGVTCIWLSLLATLISTYTDVTLIQIEQLKFGSPSDEAVIVLSVFGIQKEFCVPSYLFFSRPEILKSPFLRVL